MTEHACVRACVRVFAECCCQC